MDHLTTIRRSMEGYHARFQLLIRSNSRRLGLKRGFRYESVDHADRQMRLRNLEKKYKKITYDKQNLLRIYPSKKTRCVCTSLNQLSTRRTKKSARDCYWQTLNQFPVRPVPSSMIRLFTVHIQDL